MFPGWGWGKEQGGGWAVEEKEGRIDFVSRWQGYTCSSLTIWPLLSSWNALLATLSEYLFPPPDRAGHPGRWVVGTETPLLEVSEARVSTDLGKPQAGSYVEEGRSEGAWACIQLTEETWNQGQAGRHRGSLIIHHTCGL